MAKQVKTKKELKSTKAKKEKTALEKQKRKYDAIAFVTQIESKTLAGVVFEIKEGKMHIKKSTSTSPCLREILLSIPLKKVESEANELVEILEFWR